MKIFTYAVLCFLEFHFFSCWPCCQDMWLNISLHFCQKNHKDIITAFAWMKWQWWFNEGNMKCIHVRMPDLRRDSFCKSEHRLVLPKFMKVCKEASLYFWVHTIEHQDGRSILGFAVEDFPSFINFSKWNGNTWKFGHCIEIELNSVSQVAILNWNYYRM